MATVNVEVDGLKFHYPYVPAQYAHEVVDLMRELKEKLNMHSANDGKGAPEAVRANRISPARKLDSPPTPFFSVRQSREGTTLRVKRKATKKGLRGKEITSRSSLPSRQPKKS